MTVLDTSGVVDYLLGGDAAEEITDLIAGEGEMVAPDLLVFEVLAVLRRVAQRGEISAERAAGALADLGDLPVELFPSLPLRHRAWSLRANFTAAEALFLALAEQLDEPLATKDRALAGEAARHTRIDVLYLGSKP